jgi:FHS family glucose/mannose:H+ symporter-like MFS transporter
MNEQGSNVAEQSAILEHHQAAAAETQQRLNRYLTYLGLVGYLFIGTAAVLIPSVMPSITDEFTAAGLSLAAIGLIFPAGSIGGILGNLLSGVGSDVLGRRRLVWLSALFLAASLALAAVAKLWALFVIGFVFVSAAQGSLATGINAMIADANRGARARALNTLHGVYGAGAAVSPLIFGYLLDRGLQWRWALAGTGCIWLVYGLVVYLFHAAEMPDERVKKAEKLDFGMLRQGPFLSLFLIAFIYNGVAVPLLGWIAVFMQRSAGFSTFFSVAMISVFYVALTIGRFLCAAFAERLGYASTLLVLAIGVTVTYPLVVFSSVPTVAVAGVFLTGLSFSGLFPTSLAYGSRLYPEQTGTVSGTLHVALTLGSLAPPLWTGIIASIWGLQLALGVNYLLVLPLIVLALYLGRIEARQRKAHAVIGTAQ